MTSEAMLRHVWNERRKSEAKKEGRSWLFGFSMLFNATVNLNVKQ